MNGYNKSSDGNALISLSCSDFSEEARLFLCLLYITDRFIKKVNNTNKRVFIFAGHALDQVKSSFKSRELANFIIQVGQKLAQSTTKIIFLPNLSVNQSTELDLVSAIDVFEANSFDDWSRSATLASLEEL